MPSHFSTIGFPVESEDDLIALANSIAEEAEVIEISEGLYVRWQSSSGAQIWLQVDRDGDLVGMMPHFAGTSRVRAGLTARIMRPDATALDGAFHAWADPPDDKPEAGEYPFVFDAPDFCRHSGLTLPYLASIQLAAFAHEIDVYDSVDAFDETQTGEVRFASQSFIPSGMFTPEGGETDPPEAYGMFTGHVVQSARKRNEVTDQAFHWALVESHGASFDVVIDPEMLDVEPKVGGVVSGSFWLSGLVL